MSNLVPWTPSMGLIRPPVSGDPALTTGLVSKVLKEAPRTSSKKLDAGIIGGSSRQRTSADSPGDRRLPLSSLLKHMQEKRLPIANLLSVIAKLSAAKKAEFQTATRESLPQCVLLVSDSVQLRDQVNRYLVESGVPVHLDYHADYESFRTSPGLFLTMFAVIDANVGLEAATNVVTVLKARSAQLDYKLPIFLLAWDADQQKAMQMEGVEVLLMESDLPLVPRLPALLGPAKPTLQLAAG